MDESLKAIDYVKEMGEYIETPEGKVTASALMERFPFRRNHAVEPDRKAFRRGRSGGCICCGS